jgi:hypothetical protein
MTKKTDSEANTTSLKWRLSEQPTVEGLKKLVESQIITAEEAHSILLSEETKTSKATAELEKEVEFLKELVETLSKNRPTEIVRYIETHHPHYYRYDWYRPYYMGAINIAGGHATTFKPMVNSFGLQTQTFTTESNALPAIFKTPISGTSTYMDVTPSS